MNNGLIIKKSIIIDKIEKVSGMFEGKPFEMTWDAEECSGTIEGDFDDMEKEQLFAVWNSQN